MSWHFCTRRRFRLVLTLAGFLPASATPAATSAATPTTAYQRTCRTATSGGKATTGLLRTTTAAAATATAFGLLDTLLRG